MTEVGRDVDAWLADVRARHGDVPVHEERIEVDAATYERVRADAADDALGGGRVRLARDGELLLVSNRGEHGWDVPGGAKEPGETLQETARREVSEETGFACELGAAIAANRFQFAPAADDRPPVEGIWVYYEGTPTGGTLDPQDEELADAGWFAEPPEELDPYAEPLVVAFLEGP